MRLFWFPLILLAAPAAAQSDADIAQSTAQIGPRMIEIRHDIHRNPEMGNRETRTADLVARELTRLGLEVRSGVAHTGVVGILRGGRLGPVVAIRADMDGLPVTEQSDLPFKSIARAQYLGRETGVSHACGHDTHVAAQLGVANILAGMKDRLRGTVVFIFQPAEEGVPPGETGGAKQMVAEGVLTNPRADVILAFHANGDPPDEAGDDELEIQRYDRERTVTVTSNVRTGFNTDRVTKGSWRSSTTCICRPATASCRPARLRPARTASAAWAVP